jgi:hypothetical protein
VHFLTFLLSIPHSDRAAQHINILAVRYPRSKFVSIVGDKCIPNLPDSRLPMIIVYRKGDIRNQVVAWGSDRERRIEGQSCCFLIISLADTISPELEALLIMCGAVDPPDVRKPGGSRRDDDDSDGDDSDDSSFRKPSKPGVRGKNIRQTKKVEDSDSELDI